MPDGNVVNLNSVAPRCERGVVQAVCNKYCRARRTGECSRWIAPGSECDREGNSGCPTTCCGYICSPLGTGWEWCRSGRTPRQFFRISSKMETLSRCRIAGTTENQNIKNEQIIGFLQETRVTNLSCNNPKSALAGLEKW